MQLNTHFAELMGGPLALHERHIDPLRTSAEAVGFERGHSEIDRLTPNLIRPPPCGQNHLERVTSDHGIVVSDDQFTPAADVDSDEKASGESPPQPGADEAFCVECGAVIKKRAEICPECGVRQNLEEEAPAQQQPTQQAGGSGTDLTDRRQYELEAVASKDTGTVIAVGILLSPLAYWMIGKKALALVNFVTFNYAFLGFLIVPIHCYSIINSAKEELRRAGVAGY